MDATAPTFPTPKNLNLVELAQHFPDDAAARAYLEATRWPDGAACPHCGTVGTAHRIAANPERKVRAGLWQCAEKACGKQFTVTVGTVFEDSKVPLNKWLIAMYLICTSKKGIAALELQRLLGLGSYRTAWFMLHRIRESLKDPVFNGSPLRGIVEADATFVGGRSRPDRKYKGKKAVITVVERDGRARSTVADGETREAVGPALKNARVDPSATLMTDGARAYIEPGKAFAGGHHSVEHSAGEYVRGKGDGAVHTGTVDAYHGLFKRAHYGTYHKLSHKYLARYVAEFDYRFSLRRISDGGRTVKALQGLDGKRLRLIDLKAKG